MIRERSPLGQQLLGDDREISLLGKQLPGDDSRKISSLKDIFSKSSSTSPSSSFSADDYQRMPSTKLVKLRAASATSPPPTFVPTDAVFNNFRLITDTELRKLFISCNLKSCELDPLTPFVMVDVLDEIVPFLLYLFNRSLSEGFLPSSQKCSIIFPALKQSPLDPSLCRNYRPITNLSILSKTLVRLVSLQLLSYLEQSGFLPSIQSRFRAHHSTETALLSLLSDIYTAMDNSHGTLIALFDASSAFDMVDNEIILQRLETSFGLSGFPLNWFRSYLSDRSQMVVTDGGDTRSSWVPVQFGVPRGSVLGHLLYTLFTADISHLFAKHSDSDHLYADDFQAYVHCPPSQFLGLACCTVSSIYLFNFCS